MMALEGLKVADFAWAVAGPQVGRMLADFGATVVRVESSVRLDTTRQQGPFPGGRYDVQRSAMFENCNANKLGLTLDMGKPEGRQIARKLGLWADVLVESFRPGQMAKFGLDYATLAPQNPGLIMVSSSLLGQTGPRAGFGGFGNIGAALAGFQQIVGLPGEPPVGPFGAYTDLPAPRLALIALLAALDERRRTGKGRHIDISQVEAAASFLAPEIADAAATGHVATARGNRDAAMAPHGVFKAVGEDDWVALSVRSDDEWQRLAGLIGGAALQPCFAGLAGRQTHEEELEALVGAWVAGQAAQVVEDRLQQVGIPAHKVSAPAEMIAEPHLAARGTFVRLEHPLMGETIFEAARCDLSATPAAYTRPAPNFGRDAQQVLGGLLGLGAAEIATLEAQGVLK